GGCARAPAGPGHERGRSGHRPRASARAPLSRSGGPHQPTPRGCRDRGASASLRAAAEDQMTELIRKTIEAIEPPNARAAEAAQKLSDLKTKPQGALGRLEELACRLAAARGEVLPQVARKVVVVMAADHGVAAEGVSAYPSEVTAQMVRNFA